MTVNVKGTPKLSQSESQDLLIDLDEENQKKMNANLKTKRKGFVFSSKSPSQPVFIRQVVVKTDQKN